MLKHYIAVFWARNLTTYQVLFFVYHLGQNFFHSQTVLGQWHSSLDPQLIWISPRLDWMQFMLKHYIASFCARNLTTYQVLFFVYHLGQNFFHSQSVLRQWHSSLDPQLIWISPWLDWKAVYIENYKASFWAQILTTNQVVFSSTT